MVKDKSPARLAADARYEASHVPVLIRLTPAEVALLDRARGEKASRQAYMKAKALAAAKRAR